MRLVLVWIVVALVAWPQARKDSFTVGKPFTLEQILDAASVIFEGRLREAIQNRGVAFPATPEAMERLRKAGVSAQVVELIRRLAPAPLTPPPPEPPRPGPLTVECLPAECEVFLNGVSQGATQQGSKVFSGLSAGKVFLDFKKEGYEGSQAAVILPAGQPARHTVTLTPTPVTREKLGADVFAAFVAALGGDAGLRDAAALSAAGTLALWDPSGARTDWNLIARLQLPDRAFWEVRGAGLDWWVGLVGAQSRTGGSRKLRGSPVALEMERSIRQLLAFQPASLIQRIRDGTMRLLANAPPAPQAAGLTFRAESSTDAYQFTLGPDLAPTRVDYEPPSGLGAGLYALYGDYRPAGQTRYPMTIVVKFSGASQHGMEIRLSSLEVAARLGERDFHR